MLSKDANVNALSSNNPKQLSCKTPNQRNAFHSCPRPECLRLLHLGRIRSRSRHRPERAADPSIAERQPRAQKRASRQGQAPLLQHQERGVRARQVRFGRRYTINAYLHYRKHNQLTATATPDLSSLFNWNTKQIFLYITASYPSASPSTIPHSEAVIWDAIIPADDAPLHPNTYIHPTPKGTKSSKSKNKSKKGVKVPRGKPYPEGGKPGIVKLDAQKPKYQITDVKGKIAERENATLTLHWNVQPYVGALVWDNRRTVGLWKGLKGGVSEAFAFPGLKGSETVKSGDLKTETGGERNRGSPA